MQDPQQKLKNYFRVMKVHLAHLAIHDLKIEKFKVSKLKPTVSLRTLTI